MIKELILMYVFGGAFLLGLFFTVGAQNTLTRFVGVLGLVMGLAGGFFTVLSHIIN